MARTSWKNPPTAVVIAGNQHFLREREIRKAILGAAAQKRSIIWADNDADVVDALTMAATFGDTVLVIVPAKKVDAATVKDLIEEPLPQSCLLLTHDGPLSDKGLEAVEEVSGAFQLQMLVPAKRKDRKSFALKFVKKEADDLLGAKKTLDPRLAEALVRAVGTDVGILAHELVKMAALARARGSTTIKPEYVKSLVRASTDTDLDPLRAALRARNGAKVALEMDRIRRNSAKDPLMLILRSKGGVADLSLKWLRTAHLLRKGADASEIAARMGTAAWIVERDLIPAAKRWGVTRLRRLVEDIAHADLGVMLGAPSPMVSCEAALLLGCSQ